MASNITADLIKSETLNSNLGATADDVIEKYIKRANALVSSHVDITQFTQTDGSTLFPDDMVTAYVCIIEYLFVDQGMMGGGQNSLKSERIGDYSYTKNDTRGSKKVSGLDLPDNILAILDKYSTRAGNAGFSIGGFDRVYSDEVE